MEWNASGGELWGSRGGNIVAMTWPGGEQRTVFSGPSGYWLQDLSDDGRVLFSSTSIRREMAGRGPDEQNERNLSWLGWSQARAISEDGRMVLFGEGNQTSPEGYALFVRGTDISGEVVAKMRLDKPALRNHRLELDEKKTFQCGRSVAA